MYPKELVRPMIKELTDVGFVELKNLAQVDEFMKKKGFSLIVINSVCGCAASNARPAVIESMASEFAPKNIATVFAGVDKEAVNRVRDYMMPFPPSSPSIFLVKDEDPIYVLERHDIDGKEKQDIVDRLTGAYQKYCS